MRDLFSQCTCVCMYVSVTFRNVCRSHLGMSICGIAWECQLEVTHSRSECQFAVSLGNVNLRSRTHARNVNLRLCSGVRHWNMHSILEKFEGAGGRSWGDNSWQWRTGRTVRLALRNVRTWQSQVQQRVLNPADDQLLWQRERWRGQSTVEAKRTKREQQRVQK